MMGRRTNPAMVAKRVAAKLAQPGVSCAVGLAWNVKTGGTLDPISQSIVGASISAQTASARAFIHFIAAGSFVAREFAEVEVGDCMADFAPDVAIDGKDSLVFTINGEKWSQKPMSKELATHWDTIIGDVKILRSVLLRKL